MKSLAKEEILLHSLSGNSSDLFIISSIVSLTLKSIIKILKSKEKKI